MDSIFTPVRDDTPGFALFQPVVNFCLISDVFSLCACASHKHTLRSSVGVCSLCPQALSFWLRIPPFRTETPTAVHIPFLLKRSHILTPHTYLCRGQYCLTETRVCDTPGQFSKGDRQRCAGSALTSLRPVSLAGAERSTPAGLGM